MGKLPERKEETLGGFVVHGIPFPIDSDPDSLAFLKRIAPIQIEQGYSITYLHSYGQDSPWFAGASTGVCWPTRIPNRGTPMPRPAAMTCTRVAKRIGLISPIDLPGFMPLRCATSDQRSSSPRHRMF